MAASAGAPIKRRNAEKSFVPGVAITAGTLVIVDTSNLAQIAGAAAKNVMGVCLYNCDTAADFSASLAAPTGDRCVVGMHGEYRVTYAAAAAVGEFLKAAAAGAVTPYVTGTDSYELIVGYCTEAIAAAGVGAAYIGR